MDPPPLAAQLDRGVTKDEDVVLCSVPPILNPLDSVSRGLVSKDKPASKDVVVSSSSRCLLVPMDSRPHQHVDLRVLAVPARGV